MERGRSFRKDANFMAEGKPAGTTDLARGAAIGRYLVLNLIGRGGMGEVYAAYDPELDRKVAIKVLRANSSAGVDAAEGRGRILREAQALAQLSDPNVVAVYDVGTVDDRVFLAMEFVDGSTLSFWQHAQPRTWREVVTLYAAAGHGLAAAHRRGLVHRDFKPDNAMVGRDGQVRVMDFGLARSAEAPLADGPASEQRARTPSRMKMATTALTTPGGTLGRSPSGGQLRPGERLSASGVVVPAPGSDAVSAGSGRPARRSAPSPLELPPVDLDGATRNLAVPRSGTTPTLVDRSPGGAAASGALNVRLTQTGAMMGTPAYMAPEQFAGKAADARSDQFSFCIALYEALYGDRPFAGKSLTDLTRNVLSGQVRDAPAGANVPSWLRRVLLRGLHPAREERHPSMEALLEALSRDPPRTRRRWAAGVSVAGLIVALAAGLVQSSQAHKMKCLGAGAKLAGVWELPKLDGKLTPRKEAIRRSFMTTGKRYAEEAFAHARSELDRYVVAWNDMHRDVCEATHVRGEQSGDVLDLRMGCLQDRFNEVRALTTVFSDANGDVVSKAAEAVQSLRPVEACADVVALKAVMRAPDDPGIRRAVADVRAQLADVKALGDAGKLKQARRQIGALVDAARRTTYGPVVAETLFRSAELKNASGDAVGAEADDEEAVWIAEGTHHDELLAEAATQLVYIVGYIQDRYVDGARWSRHAGAALARMGTGHDLLAGWLANNRALLYSKQGNLREALSFAQEAVRMKEIALGSDNFDVALSEDNLAGILSQLGRVEEAVQRNARALAVLRSAVGPEHPQNAYLLTDCADLMNALGRYDAGKAAAEEALAIWNRDLESGTPLLAYALVPLGRSLTGIGQPQKAISVLDRALVLATHKDPDHMLLGEGRFALAQAITGDGPVTERSLQLAVQAREDFASVNAGADRKRSVDTWLAAHSRERGGVSVSMR
jgi:serine/threonine protein kinase/tetratricopeptide (TPR) repeat protein